MRRTVTLAVSSLVAANERDEFSGFDYQASLTTGLGYRFIDRERTKFYGQAGSSDSSRRIRSSPTS